MAAASRVWGALCLLTAGAVALPAFSSEKGTPVVIGDAALEAALRDNLGIPSDPLTQQDLESLTEFIAEGYGIVSLEGMEHCVNLGRAYLSYNEITDATPLAGMAALDHLDLSVNTNLDTSTLADLDSLNSLQLSGCELASVAFLSTLPGLTDISINANSLMSLAGIEACTGLVYLDASQNPITDISALSALVQLEDLYLWRQTLATSRRLRRIPICVA